MIPGPEILMRHADPPATPEGVRAVCRTMSTAILERDEPNAGVQVQWKQSRIR